MQTYFNFEEKPETEFLWDELSRQDSRIKNLRRGLFARYRHMEKEIERLKEQMTFVNQESRYVSDLPLFEFMEKTS